MSGLAGSSLPAARDAAGVRDRAARVAGELAPLRDAQVTFWLDWLERHEPVVHTDAVIEHLEVFHDSVAAALDWSTSDPAVGLQMLRLLARAWHGCGRPQAALTAVDRLLTDENAERFPLPWAAASAAVAVLVSTARSRTEANGLVRRGRALAEEAGDEYFVVVNDFLLGYTEDNTKRLRLSRTSGGSVRRVHRHHGAGFRRARSAPEGRGGDARRRELSAAARESRYPATSADRTASRAALYLGDLERSLALARGLCSSPSLLMAAMP